MKTSAATPSLCTTSIMMDVGHQRIKRRIMGHPRNKQTIGPPTRDSIITSKEADQRAGAMLVAEALR
jgi:hypothetical protein